MPRRLLAGVIGAGALVLALTGCVPNNTGDGNAAAAVKVAITDDTCAVTENTTPSGATAFTITNTGSDVNEFEILASDKLRIVGEKENITPGQTVTFTAQLEPGSYFTACKFQQVGSPVGLAAFTVTGTATELSSDAKKLSASAVTNYVSYITSQVGELIPAVQTFTTAYAAGDDATARRLFPTTRAFYERIEPTAEAFGDLDPKLDYREVDAAAEGLDWTGFHRIEKDLWPPAADALNSDGTSALLDWAPSSPEQRRQFADQLVADTNQLATLVNADDFTVSLADISNGAIGLLDEVASGKITGEEDWWSGTDLTDFAANVQGADVAYGNVRDIALSKGSAGKKLAGRIDAEFTSLNTLLAQYGSIDAGFVNYHDVTDAQKKELSDQVNALAEPLSRLTALVLGD
ncbi:iron uptake system protein EfeO [Rathayibacter sp. YIM 133350]|uniref:iron uptake system protein EfeO n=1 Tax=Rathayibacter sp. YIM 133350 TaxID=3131992 RepID=UPI00307F9FD0